MVVMIFVNDLDSVRGLPWWTHHAPAKVDVMTYVDMVYPFFLFAIGLSLPLAVKARLKKTSSEFALWTHVVIRSVSLIVLGLILANAEKGDPARIGFSSNLWAILALLGAALYLSVYTGSGLGRTVHRGLRILGLILVVAMYAIFRRATPNGGIGWIDGSYPEILGLIGYTFLAVSILYIPTRRWLWTPPAWLIALVTFNALCIAKWIHLPEHLPLYFWPFDNGAMVSITMAGIVTSVIFLGDHRWKALGQKLSMAAAFALAAVAAGPPAYSAGHLQNPSHTNVVPLLHLRCRYLLRDSVLDLRREEENRLGFLRAARGFKYFAHVSAAGLLLLHRRRNRLHVL